MQFLRLMGVGSDGSALILVGTEGQQFRLPVDDALRSAVRGARPTVVSPSGSAPLGLPPREIQARLRGGATAEDVARDAGVPVEKVRRYEVPILAERNHIASRAQHALLRRPAAGLPAGGGASSLGEIVAQRVDDDGYEAEAVGWDAWRREDGRWTVQVTLPGEPTAPAQWIFDAPTRAVSPANDVARELLMVRAARPDPISAIVHSLDAAREESPARSEPQSRESGVSRQGRDTGRKSEPRRAAAKNSEASNLEQMELEQIELPERQAVGESRRSGRRPVVPAWDDILLGARRND